jgi:membrane protein implicated in regulation of membrane protease activity
MDSIFLTIILILLVLIPTAFCIWLVYTLYSIPAKNGQKKIGIFLSSIVGLFFIYIAVNMIFEDELFSKNEAKNLLVEQNIVLNNDFKLVENKSMSAIGDYYHTFTLKITEEDKIKIINEIKNSKNFNLDSKIENYFDNREDYYNGPKRIKNYETEKQFVRELFEPQGKGYAPTWRKIEVNKNENTLTFEDIDE